MAVSRDGLRQASNFGFQVLSLDLAVNVFLFKSFMLKAYSTI